MDSMTFEHTLKTIEAAGLVISESEYSEKSFGSWFITVLTTPRRRFVWDGKERWYVVEEETEKNFHGIPVWKELWIDRSPTSKSTQIGIEHLYADKKQTLC